MKEKQWHYVDPFCGSCAVPLALLGARRSIMPYQGGKWRHRHGILVLIRSLGFTRRPSGMHLSDAGPWGQVGPMILRAETRAKIIEQLHELVQDDPREVYDRIRQGEVGTEAIYAARFLFLQRVSFSYKAVGERSGSWQAPGFHPTHAYGCPGTARFGVVHPQVPSLIRNLEAMRFDEQVPSKRALACHPAAKVTVPTLVYLDPPYAGTTGYPDGELTRADLVRLALAWEAAGAAVLVSEAAPVEELVSLGWSSEPLLSGKPTRAQRPSNQRTDHKEWLTSSKLLGGIQ